MQSICDPLQNDRLELVIDGSPDGEGGAGGVAGLLPLVSSCHSSDSCRAYQAVKCLVTAASKSPAVRERLLADPAKWQHAVNWLKSKMADSSSSSYWTPSSDSVLSNEDSSTRTFQRTTSAQVTLDEAKAMLADFDASEADKETAMDTNNDDNIFNIDTDTVDP